MPSLAQKPGTADPDANTQDLRRERSEQSHIIERYKWFMRGRLAPAGHTMAEMRIRAFRQKLALRQSNLQRWTQELQQLMPPNGGAPTAPAGGSPLSTPAFNSPWTHLGPTPIGRENSAFGDVTGRATAIAIDQTDSTGNTVLVGGAYGGVWKSTNAANATSDNVTWTPLSDSEASLAANAIAISPADHNIILVGTGEPDFAGDSYYGLGIMRSTDGGATWTLITQDATGTHPFRGMGVAKFAWSTANTNLVVAAFSNGSSVNFGSLTGGQQGIYFSTDAGITWNKATSSDAVFGSTNDVVYSPAENKFFASLRSQGIYSSTNGSSWTRLAFQPVAFTSGCQSGASCDMIRAALAVHPTRDELYAIVINSNGDTVKGVARTLNGGTTAWTSLNITGINSCGPLGEGGCGGGQGFYDLILAAVPNGTNTDLYTGIVNLYRCPSAQSVASSTNCFVNLSHVYGSNPIGSHPDYHSIDYLRANPSIIYWGNDGGLYRTTNALVGTGATAAQNLNAHLGSFSQFVGMAQHPTDASVFTGGLQDNGSLDRDSVHDSDVSPNTTWVNVLGGDGGYAAIDQGSPNLWYNEQVVVTVQRCDTGASPGNDGTGTSGGCIPNAFATVVCSAQGNGYNGCTRNIPDEGPFYTKFILDPANQSQILVGTCRVWRGAASGTGWSAASFTNALSNQLSSGSSAACGGSEPMVFALTAGGPSTANGSQVIYAGLDNGQVFVTTNATTGITTWTERTGPWGAGHAIGDIEIDTQDATGLTAYVAVQQFGQNHVWKTINGGQSWTAIGTGLPDVPADAIAVDPNDATGNTIYVGTDMGVYYTTDGGSTWAEYGPATGAGAFPNSPVTELLIFNSGGTQRLRASTYGRGVWENNLVPNNDFSLSTGAALATVRPGGTANWAVTVAKAGSFAGSVTMSCSPNPPTTGTSCSISPNPANLSAVSSVPVTLNVPTTNGTTAVDDYAFNLHGTDGASLTHDLALTLRVNDFAIGSSTTPQTIQQTGSGTYLVTITPSGNFSDPITLSCANFTSLGVSCQFSQDNFIPGTTPTQVTVTVNAAANATVASNQTFNVVATGDGTQHSVQLGYSTILVQDFTFVGNTTSQTVLAGATANFSGTLTPLNSFSASNMTVGCTGLPAGAACQFSPAAPSISGGTPLPIAINVTTTPGTTPAGNYDVTATVSDSVSGKTHSVDLSLAVQDFSVSVSPTSRTVAVGAGTTYTVTVTGQNGFAGSVALGCGTLPANVSCSSFVPASVDASAAGTTATLTVLTTTSVTTGAKTIPVTGTASSQTRSVNTALNVSSATPSFNLTISPSSRAVAIGGSTTYTINVKATTTTSPGTVTLSCVQPLPAGVSCSFSPASLAPRTTGTNVTATVFTTLATPPASTSITFRAATTAMFKQINGTLQPTDFSFGVSPSNQVIPAPGGTAQYSVSMQALDGFNSSVALSCTGLPAGWSCGFAPSPATPTAGGVTSTLTVTTTASPFGPTNITVQGAAGSLVHSQQVTVTNGSNDYLFGLASGTALVAVRPGQTANWSVQLSRFGTFSANVAESCVYSPTAPAGVACNITPNPAVLTTAACPNNGACATAALAIPTNSSTTAVGDYTFNFHGNGGGSQHDLPLTLRVNDFGISSNTSPQTIQQANSATYNVTVTSLNNYGGTVALSCANFTSLGVSCAFSQNNFVPTAAGTAVTVTVSAAANAPVASSQTFDVVATDGSTSHSVNLGYSTILVQDFTYTNSTAATQTVLPGQQANYSTMLTPLNSFSANVTLTCSGLPANTTCSFNPTSPVAIGSATPKPVTVTINTTNTTPAGNATITVTANDPVSGKTHAVNNLSLAVQSFTMTATPTSRTIPPGSGTTFSVTVNAQNGLTQPVTLSCPAPPAGLTCTPPAPITPGSSGTMTVFAASSTTAGTKTLTIRGTTGAGVPIVNQNVSIVVSTTAPSFTISDSVPTKSVAVGGAVTYSLAVRSTSTISPGTVTMSCMPPLPAGVSCSFNPTSFTPTTTARTVTATVHTTASTPAQSFALQFQGTTTTQFKTSNFTLNVGDYALAVNPSTQTISSASGGSTQYTITLTSIDAFSTAVSLSCTGLPANWSCGFSPASVTPTGAGANSTLTLTTTNSPLGPTNFTVQGSGGGLVHTQQVQVINGQDFTLSAGGPITVQQGGNNTVQINATAIGTFASSIALSCPSLQAGFTCGFNPASITPGTPSTLTISASGAVTGGQYSIAVQGQSSSPSLTHTSNVTVNVPDFSVSLNGASSIVLRGGSLQLSGTATALGGFSTSTTFTCSTGDVNAPCVASSPVTPTAGGAAITVTVSPNGSATAGAHTVTLTGNDGAGHVHSATFGITVEDFSVGATDLNATVEAGATTGSYAGTVTGLGGFTGNVTLSCSSAIALTCAFTPNPVAASGAGTAYSFTITPDPAATVGGPYAVTITGTGPGSATHTATVHISVTATQDWSYTYQPATPQTQTVNAGQSGTYNINLSPNNGFNSSVTLTCAVTGTPAGVGCGITGSPVAGGSGTITLTVSTTVGTVAPNAYDIVVSGTGGGKTRTTTAHLTVKDFALGVTPGTQTVAPGTTADYTVSITSASFPSTPTLACQILTAPAGANCSFDSTSVAPGSSTLLHVSSTNGTTPPGSYTVQVTATSGSTVHTSSVTYVVQNPVGFTMTTSTPSVTVKRGSFAAYSVTVTAIGGFSSSVQLSCTGMPVGTSCTSVAAFVPSASGTTKTVPVSATLSATPGTYNVTISGTGGGQTHTLPVQLIVQ